MQTKIIYTVSIHTIYLIFNIINVISITTFIYSSLIIIILTYI